MASNRPAKRKRRIWQSVRPYVMIGPAMIGIITFVIYPMLYLIYLSFYKYNLMNKDKSKFIGFDNFTQIFSREDFYKSLGNTVVYTVGVVTLTMAISLLIAVWISKKRDSTRSCKPAFLRRISFPSYRSL
ncbi:hypothetical protein PACILC2_30500 [Paenibacillus cisolokensis]|uniref:ABC transmembrane type-1 domain-containing protein n=1 Tax=Paenibacillus cisolokensis TaxID=1658519 RepID=A0ABQ4N8G0_9BACL|nr:hypothetical protein PACILC2_30500 [Paenibacillus cisolokensis]